MSTVGEAPVGKVETLRFARLLARFWDQGFSGSFRARANPRPGVSVSKEIFFERGRVAWAASDDPEEGIRSYLINRGLLRPDQWDLAEEKAGNGQLRQTLLDLGFLTARELQEADRERVTAIVLSLFTWRDGRYEIAPGPPPHGTPNLRIDPRDLVLEGLMSSGDRGRVLDEIGTLDAVLVVRPDDLVRASLSLPVELVGLMGKADGTRTVADICALSPLPDFLISAAFAGLKVLGLARPVGAASAAAPPAPPVPAPEKPPTRRRAAWSQGSPAETEPRLPLSDDHETGPIAATPPAGVPAADKPDLLGAEAPDSDEDDSGTRPMRPILTRELEPEAVAERVAGAWGPPKPPAAPVRPASAPVGPAHQEVTPPLAAPVLSGAEDEDDGTGSPATGGPACRREDAPTPIQIGEEEEEEEAGREAEVELKPGIPVEPVPLSIGHGGQASLSDGEIDDVLGAIEGPAARGGPAVEPPPPAAAPDGDEAAEEEGGEFEETPAEEEDEDAWIDGDEATTAQEPPVWVYQPSGAPDGRGRWASWRRIGLLAAGLICIGSLALYMFGSGGEPPSEPAGTSAALQDPGPPEDLRPPAAFAPDQSLPPKIATAAVGDREPVPAPPPPAPTRPLASGRQGAIFSSGSSAEGRRLLEAGDLPGAARRFEEAVSGRKGLYTVQIAIACEPRTVTRALGTTRGSSQFFILATSFRGQPCYRMLWGTYASREAAEAARPTLPPLFLKDPNPPKVTSLR